MSYNIKRSEFIGRYHEKENQFLYPTCLKDVIDPFSLFTHLVKADDSNQYKFLFQSVSSLIENANVATRFSIVGCYPDLIFSCKDYVITKQDGNNNIISSYRTEDPLAELGRVIEDSKFGLPDNIPIVSAGIFGYFGYDTIRYIESLPDKNYDELNISDILFMRPQITLVFDHSKNIVTLGCPVYYKEDVTADEAYDNAIALLDKVSKVISNSADYEWQADLPSNDEKQDIELTKHDSFADYKAMFDKAKDYIHAGDVFQVVLSQRFSVDFQCDPLFLYYALCKLNPSPYLFYIDCGDYRLVGSSPEILSKIEHDKITVRPMAGTRKRGKNKAEDEELKRDLLSDRKETAEHLMLLDLARNDVSRVCCDRSLEYDNMFFVEYYSHVMHIVSNVCAKKREDITVLDVLKSCFPVGTVSGAPKIRAMEIIDELENIARSFYSGGVGYFSVSGDMDIAIAIRTSLVKDGKLYIQAGGGIVADSIVENEYQEILNKAGALVEAARSAINYKF